MTPHGSSDCGFYSGDKVHRGYFNGANAASASITASGGLAFGWSAWHNGPLIGGNPAKIRLNIGPARAYYRPGYPQLG
ncbi:hypothetical protein K456DRAFT_1731345 [Colletotrichum gloeosporioides 23]|nr:hypothetical protein K456DRAFT_1731345 [Colletotrichum gloeosporioides 23]KAJ0272486.1 hypothetical protein CBS470a_012680 [Colletotrichum nupharicola]KAJ0272976.1 hypothetical protein COL940_010142 [Colletotrichum noveboracense]